jgi:GDSL-like Lipase/Acylhydrolase
MYVRKVAKLSFHHPRIRGVIVWALLGASCLAISGAASAGAARVAQARYPNSIVVLGHSGATGQNSDPNRPGVDVRANSWATGTNPAVDSLYLRILAKNPKIKGRRHNLAQDGATVSDLVLQARQAVSLKPKPDLVVIQIMDNDMVCPVKTRALNAFRSTFISALKVLARKAPKLRLFVVSQFGSPTTFWRVLTPEERAMIGGSGPCDFLDPAGQLVQTKLDRLEKDIHAYEAQLRIGCARVRQCRYDGGALGRIVDKREYWNDGLDHYSIEGHAEAAAVAWAAMQSVGIIPRSG